MKRKIKHVLTVLLFAAAVTLLVAGAKKDAAANKQEQNAAPVYDSGFYSSTVSGQVVVITGTVRLVGSDPFPRYVITEAGKYDWYIPDPEDRKVISGLEQQIVTIQGTVVLRELVLANGEHLGTERELTSISLIKK